MVTSFKWTTVGSEEVEAQKYRLEASVFKVEAKKAKDDLLRCKFPIVSLTGENGIATAYHRLRFRRVFVDKSDLPIFQPSQITEIEPKPEQFISRETKTNIDALRVKKGQVLMTCSGTIGKCTFTSETLNNKIFSHDLLRITANNAIDAGYIYAYCKTQVGQLLLITNNYGAVISHIEPEHLDQFSIPYPDERIRLFVNHKIEQSFLLRDKSNHLINEAEKLLIKSLQLPPLSEIQPEYYNKSSSVNTFLVSLDESQERLDASYHVPIVGAIIDYLIDNTESILPLGNAELTKKIVLPGRFKRHYVDEKYGKVFFGGKQIFEIDPSNKKYLSLKQHGSRIDEQLLLRKNTLLVTRSGTIGRVNIVPQHWENWVANEHILRAVPRNSTVAGYLYIWLNSDYGRELIKRQTYGSVVDEIDDKQLGQIPVPILKDKKIMQTINEMALEGNDLRTEAYRLEQEAINTVNSEVIYAGGVKTNM